VYVVVDQMSFSSDIKQKYLPISWRPVIAWMDIDSKYCIWEMARLSVAKPRGFVKARKVWDPFLLAWRISQIKLGVGDWYFLPSWNAHSLWEKGGSFISLRRFVE
jgi:hypothetical protein